MKDDINLKENKGPMQESLEGDKGIYDIIILIFQIKEEMKKENYYRTLYMLLYITKSK